MIKLTKFFSRVRLVMYSWSSIVLGNMVSHPASEIMVSGVAARIIPSRIPRQFFHTDVFHSEVRRRSTNRPCALKKKVIYPRRSPDSRAVA